MSDKPRVLFLCTGNACRSQMAEGWLRHLASDRFEVLSAGSFPAGLSPGAVESMGRVGIDISQQTSNGIHEYLDDPPDLIIAVCASAAKSCPSFPGSTRTLRWPVYDPVGARGTPEEVRRAFDEVRDEIGARLRTWLEAGAPFD